MSEDELNKKVDITLKELLTIIKFEMLKEPSAIVHRPNLQKARRHHARFVAEVWCLLADYKMVA